MSVDEAWGVWTRDNLARGVQRSELCDEMLIAGLAPNEVSELVQTQFDEIRQRAFDVASPLSLPLGAQHIMHPGSGCIVGEVTDFLSPEECDHLISLGVGLVPSTILGGEDPRYVRTSKTSQIGLREDNVLSSIDARISSLFGLPGVYSEPLQLHVYERDAFFADHTDYLPHTRLDAFDKAFGQRTYSVLIYIRAPVDGGQTVFPSAGISITPRSGSLVYWHNLTEQGSVNPATKHRSEPVIDGEKIILTKWFRLPSPAAGLRFPGELVEPPPFKFRSATIAQNLHAQLRKELAINSDRSELEIVSDAHLRLSDPNSDTVPSTLIPMSSASRTELINCAKKLVEEITDQRVCDPVVYGIRKYNPGATLRLHYDRRDSHHVGVIFCIDRSNTGSWPLFIETERGSLTAVEPNAGDAIIFAAASVLHGRPCSLADGHVWNAFVHFRLEPHQ